MFTFPYQYKIKEESLKSAITLYELKTVFYSDTIDPSIKIEIGKEMIRVICIEMENLKNVK